MLPKTTLVRADGAGVRESFATNGPELRSDKPGSDHPDELILN